MTRVRRGFWFPLAVFGVIVLSATGFYWQTLSCNSVPGAGGSFHVCVGRRAPSGFVVSGLHPFVPSPLQWASLYWAIALPVSLLVIAGFLWRQHRRDAATLHIAPTAIAMLALLGVLVAMSSNVTPDWMPRVTLPGDLAIRGLVALLIIAVGLGALALAERSLLLGVFVAAFLALSFLANLYDISNVVGFGTNPGPQALPNVVLPGLFLILGAIGFGLFDLRASATPRPSE